MLLIVLVFMCLIIGIASDDTNVSMMAQNTRLKFDRYWGDIECCNFTYIVAMLDPMHKYEFAEFSLYEVYSEGIDRYIMDKIKCATHDLFSAYNALLNPQSSSKMFFLITTW